MNSQFLKMRRRSFCLTATNTLCRSCDFEIGARCSGSRRSKFWGKFVLGVVFIAFEQFLKLEDTIYNQAIHVNIDYCNSHS